MAVGRVRIRRRALLTGFLFGPAARGRAAPPPPGAAPSPHPSDGMIPTFDYLPSRDGLALQTGGPTQAGYRAAPAHVWQPRFPTEDAPKGHSNTWNGEYQFYADPEYPWKGGFSPFSIEDGVLRIRAERTEGIAAIAGELPDNPATHRPYEWVSGVLSSKGSFAQQGGYFEIEARMPKGIGTWPAFWLLPTSNVHPPELDVIEYLGHEPTQYRATWISLGPVDHATTVRAQVDLSLDFHRYGLQWTDTALAFYLDGACVATSPIVGRREFWQDFYLVVNLAIGSDKQEWVPPPGPDTPSPIDLLIRGIKAWQRRGPRKISLSRNAIREDAKSGATVATLSCLTDESRPSITYGVRGDGRDAFKTTGRLLVTCGTLNFLLAQAHDCIIEADDAHGRTWQQPVSIAVLDTGVAPNALAPGSQETLAHPAWTTYGMRIVGDPAGSRTQMLLAQQGASVFAVEQLLAKEPVARRYIVSADLAPHDGHRVKIEVSRNYGKNVQAIFDLARFEVSGAVASPDPVPFRLNDCCAIDIGEGFCRCLIDLTTDAGMTMRVSIKPDGGVRSGSFFRVVDLG